jgi:hypothetical protein
MCALPLDTRPNHNMPGKSGGVWAVNHNSIEILYPYLRQPRSG